jgi:hypothetical protein
MVRDEALRKIRAEAGKKGGNPVLLNQNQTTIVKQITTPSARKMKTEEEEAVISSGFEGTELSVANALLMNLSIPSGEALLRLVSQALTFECARLGSPEKAIASLETEMKAVKGTGVKWFLWFQDQCYLPSTDGGKRIPGPRADKSTIAEVQQVATETDDWNRPDPAAVDALIKEHEEKRKASARLR